MLESMCTDRGKKKLNNDHLWGRGANTIDEGVGIYFLVSHLGEAYVGLVSAASWDV